MTLPLEPPAAVPPGTETPHLVVEGRSGLLEGVRHVLGPGQTLVVGRSRSCHVSLRRTPEFLHHPDPVKLLLSPEFNRVSRIHCEIEFLRDGRIEIRDLSRNGTLVDGRRIERSTVVEGSGAPVRVELADPAWGRLVLTRS